MSRTENKRSVIVGIFVLIAIGILVAGIFTLGGQQNRFQKSIRLQAIFDDIEGLRKGNNVWFSGVKVGYVREISFYGDSQLEVTMQLEQDIQQYIRKDAKVKLSSDGLIGNKILSIEGGSMEAPPVEDGDNLAVEVPLSTDDIMASLQENNQNLVSITNNLKALTTNMINGEGTVGALFQDNQMAEHFRVVMANLEQVSNNTVRASSALTQFTNKLNTSGGLANELLTDTVVFSQLKTSANQLQQIVSSAETVTENLSEASNKMTTTDNGLGIILNDEEFGSQLKNTMRNLETSSEKLDENMEALQHNFLFRGYFRRQAREEARQ
ncbi:MlaD family protein [Catalinimonas niigatensis]|uniref:MlaD family protein n=1 Tax=Catalinimonas niigatensis TaxID=1397264 RepID=UPI0026667747|nr:MlaD family protein [Catalinimonas niigatensis]WPP48182.1 MlaD family protein [Catalinimonas niigatensis]